MSGLHDIDEVIQWWDRGLLAKAEVASHLLPMLREDNIESTMTRLPVALRRHVEEQMRAVLDGARGGETLVDLGPGSVVPAEAMRAIEWWSSASSQHAAGDD